MVSQVVVFELEADFEFLVVADLSAAVDSQVLWRVFLSGTSHLINAGVIETHLLTAGKKSGVF